MCACCTWLHGMLATAVNGVLIRNLLTVPTPTTSHQDELGRCPSNNLFVGILISEITHNMLVSMILICCVYGRLYVPVLVCAERSSDNGIAIGLRGQLRAWQAGGLALSGLASSQLYSNGWLLLTGSQLMRLVRHDDAQCTEY